MARETSRRPFSHPFGTAHRRCAFEAVQPPSLDRVIPLLERQARDNSGLFWAEGCRSFFAALEHGWDISAVVYCPKLLKSGAAWQALRSIPHHSLLKVNPDEFGLLTRRLEPDGIGVVCPQRREKLIEQAPTAPDVWVALDDIRTAGNLGTIVRTCAAVGVKGLMLIGGEADAYDPAAIRASMGAIFSVPLIRTSAKALAGWKSRRPIEFVGTSPAASTDYRELSYRTPIVLMMGSERSGLRERQMALCDHIVSLPMTSRVDSLNLAVATSVMLYEIGRKRTRLQ